MKIKKFEVGLKFNLGSTKCYIIAVGYHWVRVRFQGIGIFDIRKSVIRESVK